MNKKLIPGKYRSVQANTPLRCTALDTSGMNSVFTSNQICSGKTDFVSGACMMVRKEVFKKVGLLPEDYFMYFEDVDFCQKVRQIGYSCYLYAKPLVKHHVSSSAGIAGTNILTPLRAYFYGRNPFIYIKKNVKGSLIILNYFGQFFIRLPYYGVQMIKQRQFISILSYLKGFFDGIFFKP